LPGFIPQEEKTRKKRMNDATDKFEKLKCGDAHAWEELVAETSPKLFALFGSMLGLPDSRVRELVSEVYAKAYKNIKNFRGESQIKTWLSAIATNLARDYIRKIQMEKKHINYEDTNELEFSVEQPEIDDESDKIRILLEEMPETYRKALMLYYMEEHKYEKISQIMNIPIGTVKTLLFRGKKMMRELYIKKYGGVEL